MVVPGAYRDPMITLESLTGHCDFQLPPFSCIQNLVAKRCQAAVCLVAVAAVLVVIVWHKYFVMWHKDLQLWGCAWSIGGPYAHLVGPMWVLCFSPFHCIQSLAA